MTQPTSTMPRGRMAVLLVAGLLALGVLLALGTWQVQRLAWKEDLIATIGARIEAPPSELAGIEARLADGEGVDYWPVTVSGTFRHEGERHFFATHEGRSGYMILTPLEMDDGRFILVNRGFVPFERKGAETRPEGQVAGEVEITGLARDPLFEKPSFIVPDNDLGKNVFYWKDFNALVGSSGVGTADDYVGLLIDADDSPNPGGLPVGGVTLIDLPNNHLQYAVTWYGLALALCGVLGAWLWRQRRPS